MTREELIQEIEDVLMNFPESDMVDIHNRYCEDNNYYDDQIYYMGDLECIYDKDSHTLFEIVSDLSDINESDDYFYISIYGYKSFTYYTDGNDLTSDIAYYCIQNDEDFECSEIRELLDKFNEEEENEDDE